MVWASNTTSDPTYKVPEESLGEVLTLVLLA